jgi:YbgC/YbaW family acyl-CoA thioester hydrolase
MSIQLTVYPDECDAFGHLNQAAYLALFERARWELLARGPGMDAFTQAGVWPAVRRCTIDFRAGAWPGDVLAFEVTLVGQGRTSFTLRQQAVRTRDQRLVAVAEIVFVCIDRDERPVAVPDDIIAALTAAPRMVRLADGSTIALDEAGQSGVPVLFVHGYPLDRTMWRAQLEGITGHHLLAPDLRGFGVSPLGGGGTTLAQHADDLAALLDVLEINQVVFAGLSMGGYLAFEFLRRHRDRVRGLVLMDTKAEADDEAGRAGRDAAIVKVAEEGAGAIAAAMGEKLFAQGTPPNVREAMARQMAGSSVSGIMAALVAMRDRADSTDLLPSLAGLPTLVIVGAEDQLTPPAAAERMVAAIPGAELVVVEGAGHLPPVERPATVNEALQRFLDSLV